MHINYTDVVSRRSQITSRIPMRYTPGRSWESVRERRVLSLGCGPVEGSQFKELLASAAGVEGVDTDHKTGALYRTLAEVPSGEFTSLVAEHVLEHMTHDQILDAFENRVGGTMAEERLTAIAQILRIVRFRLESRVTQEGATRP